MRSKRLGVALCIGLMVASCAPRPLPASGSTAQAGVYKLGAGDRFRMTVYNETALTGQEYTIDSNGDSSLPLIGVVHLGGLTPRAGEILIAQRYAQGYLNNPKVNIDVTAYRPFYILGEVNKPGAYPFQDGMSVLNAVALAEGFTYRANQKRIYIKRAGSNAEEVVPLAADTRVNPGDTVRIVEAFL